MQEHNTKTMKKHYNDYQKSNKTNLYQCYKSFSHEKYNALWKCHEIQDNLHGTNGRIISHNGFAFSYGFTYTDKDNGNEYFVYITKDGTTRAKINKLSNIIL